MSHDVFICHSSKDRLIANAICSSLEQSRIRCWIAPRDVLPGSDYAESIVGAIAGSKLTVLVFSEHSNRSPHVRRELERTVSHGIPILPFRVQDVVPSPALEYFISSAHWLDAVTPPMEQHLQYLVGTVRMLLEREAAVTTPAPPEQRPLAPPPPPPPPPPPGQPGPASEAVSPPRLRRTRLWVGIGAAVVTALIVGLLAAGGVFRTDTDSDAGAGDAAPTVQPPAEGGGPPAAAEDFYDPFDGGVDSRWMWVNEQPSRWQMDPLGRLNIDATASPPIENVLLTDLEGYQSLVTLLYFRPTENYQFAGIVLTGDDPDDDRLQFGRAFCGDPGCVGDGVYFDRVEDGQIVGRADPAPLAAGTEEVHLQLMVVSGSVTGQYSLDGQQWSSIGSHPFDPDHTRVGLIAHQAPTPITASFEDALLVAGLIQ